MTMIDTDSLISSEDAAALLGISKFTLASWRCRGTHGPKFLKWGRAIRYQKRDVLDWIEAHKVSSTSEYAARKGAA